MLKSGGQKRKSARISALEASNADKRCRQSDKTHGAQPHQQPLGEASHENAVQPPPPGSLASGSGSGQPLSDARKGPKKRRLQEVASTSLASATPQDGEDPKQENPPVSSGWIPPKYILEFILDILQRRDTHEIFAQPVDPKEVEGYYDIIKDPMDFGTMRAKLQEGLYTTLKQFENDVFLISSNAMHFNSSATIYFRQARAIHELAKRVFHTLETDPRKIEQEFSLTRKRPGRKPQGETGGSRTRLANNIKRNVRGYRWSSSSKPPLDYKDTALFPGFGDDDNLNFQTNERRQTYKPQTSLASESESVVSTVSKQLIPGNGCIGYRESLLQFVENLGPTAKMVANRKLKCLTETPSYQSQTPNWLLALPAPQRAKCADGLMENRRPRISRSSTGESIIKGNAGDHLGVHAAAYKGKNVQTMDWTDIHGASRDEVTLGSAKTDVHAAALKGKSIVTGDNIFDDTMATTCDRVLYSGFCGGKMTPTTDWLDIQGTSSKGKNVLSGGSMETYHGSCGGKMDFLSGIMDNHNSFEEAILPSSDAAGVRSVVLGLGAQGNSTWAKAANASQLGQLEFMSRGNPRPKSLVYPSKIIKPSSSSRTSTTLALESRAVDQSNALLDQNYGASSAQASQAVEWSRPTPWGPQAICGFPLLQPQFPEVNPLGTDSFMQQESQSGHATVQQHSHFTSVPCMQLQAGEVNPVCEGLFVPQQSHQTPTLFLQQMPNEFLQQPLGLAVPLSMLGQGGEGSAAIPFVHSQLGDSNPLGQDGYAQQDLQLALAQYMQPQAMGENSLGHNAFLQEEEQFAMPPPFREGAPGPGLQEEGDYELIWNLQQQALMGTQHPDLNLQL